MNKMKLKMMFLGASLGLFTASANATCYITEQLLKSGFTPEMKYQVSDSGVEIPILRKGLRVISSPELNDYCFAGELVDKKGKAVMPYYVYKVAQYQKRVFDENISDVKGFALFKPKNISLGKPDLVLFWRMDGFGEGNKDLNSQHIIAASYISKGNFKLPENLKNKIHSVVDKYNVYIFPYYEKSGISNKELNILSFLKEMSVKGGVDVFFDALSDIRYSKNDRQFDGISRNAMFEYNKRVKNFAGFPDKLVKNNNFITVVFKTKDGMPLFVDTESLMGFEQWGNMSLKDELNKRKN